MATQGMKYRKVPLDKLWVRTDTTFNDGVAKIKKVTCASVRSYIVEEAKAKGQGIQIIWDKKTMSIPHSELDHHYKNNYKLSSKRVKGQVYDLYDFDWVDDLQIQQTLF